MVRHIGVRGLVAVGLIVSAVMSKAVAAPAFTQLYVFGDSLSDVGNNGRYSAGYLWGEHVAGSFGQTLLPSRHGGTDYAVSGALITATEGQILSLPAQVAQYLAANPQADANALYVIWGGGNDVFSTLSNPKSGTQIETAGIADTVAMVKSLQAAGARSIVVGNVPRTDLTPYIQGMGSSEIAQQKALVVEWNQKLQRQLFAVKWGKTRVYLYDSAAALAAIFASPTHFNFTDITVPCGKSCADPDHTLFWDHIHPGATEHAAIGAAIEAVADQ